MKNDQRKSYYYIEKERLKREINLRESQLAALEASYLDRPHRLISEAISRRNKFSGNNYLDFIKLTLRESHIYGIWEHILKFFRRFRLITTILQIFIAIVTFISTSAFYLVFISLTIIALPFIVLGLSLTYFRSLLSRKRIIRSLEPIRCENNIVIIFMPVNYSEKSRGDYSLTMARDFAKSDAEVFVVAPLNTKLKIRKEAESLHLITQSDYFYFDKKLFRQCRNVVKIHL